MKVNLTAKKYPCSQRFMSSFFFASKANNEASKEAERFGGHAFIYILKADWLSIPFLRLFTTK